MNTILGALQVAHLSGLPENRPTERPIHLAEKFPLFQCFRFLLSATTRAAADKIRANC